MKELHLSIVSPEKSIFDGDVKIVTLPGMIGSFSILPGHAPIVSSLIRRCFYICDRVESIVRSI